ncbi:hypothetical protein [Mycobacterium sp. PSTR-4-N]|uniref:hypothetical protein n=1 Tax=Mycobacterium sp. PSTR-4-N TaxID=2917745 RepID=UPI001F14BD72|nr:hypothetical protein [Mycobacterium sp. PSTR-4-N]MCG7596356.1 hypothetical protein [Mycobacterium sp. PSTR-4-N]
MLDDDGQPVFTDYGEPITDNVTLWVDRACFEIQTPTELQDLTVTTSEIAWAMLPIADGMIPAVDDDDTEAPIAFRNEITGLPTINANAWLRHNGLRYTMRGDSVLEQDIRGREDHVFAVCERQQG